MKKSDLKNGMVVETRDGLLFIIIDDVAMGLNSYLYMHGYKVDLTDKAFNELDIVKVYDQVGYDFLMQIDRKKLKLLWERKELTEREIEVLKALKTLGYEWISRDNNGNLYANVDRPIKSEDTWYLGGYCLYLFKHIQALFQFITWQDEEPTNINDLLGGNL